MNFSILPPARRLARELTTQLLTFPPPREASAAAVPPKILQVRTAGRQTLSPAGPNFVPIRACYTIILAAWVALLPRGRSDSYFNDGIRHPSHLQHRSLTQPRLVPRSESPWP